jgi:hypothetical protein
MSDWDTAKRLVSDWAARNGLRVSLENDPTIAPEFDPEFLNVTSDPYPDSGGVTFARPTVASLMRRYVLYAGTQHRLPGYEFIEVRLVRHGRQNTVLAVSPEELQRFGLEARHLDRID